MQSRTHNTSHTLFLPFSLLVSKNREVSSKCKCEHNRVPGLFETTKEFWSLASISKQKHIRVIPEVYPQYLIRSTNTYLRIFLMKLPRWHFIKRFKSYHFTVGVFFYLLQRTFISPQGGSADTCHSFASLVHVFLAYRQQYKNVHSSTYTLDYNRFYSILQINTEEVVEEECTMVTQRVNSSENRRLREHVNELCCMCVYLCTYRVCLPRSIISAAVRQYTIPPFVFSVIKR